MTDTPGYENATIPGGGEYTPNWNHPKISGAFSPLDVNDANGQAGKYLLMKLMWEQGFETFLRSTQASLAQAWSGPAAEQSKRAIQDYIDKCARPVTPALDALANGIKGAAQAIVDTKTRVGEPLVADGAFLSGDGFKGFFNTLISDDEISRRTQVAQAAMKTYYVDRFVELDTQIPVIPVPAGPTSTTDIPAPPPGGYNTDTGKPSATSPGTPAGTTGETPTGETPGTPEGETPGETPGETTQPTTTDPGDTATAPASTETPTGTTPTVPASTTPAGVTTGPGSPGGTPSGTPGSPGTPESQTPGRTVQGAPNTAAGAPAGVAAGAANAAGNRGMGGMPMGGAGAGRGGGQDDESKRSVPDYLINQENADELLGDIPPTIDGGVIGSNPG
ncbi:hypothetical protein [Nocardia sp. NPDC024068]|uniref:WXG100 family type VII secretion target n=1 Tax=Nocardia sp. NPDC024068 TaxID=3157197 RepID=UPI0033FAE086